MERQPQFTPKPNRALNFYKLLFLCCLLGSAIVLLYLYDPRWAKFGPSQNPTYIININRPQNLDKTLTDFLLNTRKLSLFAVQELNRVISTSKKNLCAAAAGLKSNCPKWWTNPLDAVQLGTRRFRNFSEHDIVFFGNPGHLAIRVIIRQRPMTVQNAVNTTELEIVGDFKQLVKRPILQYVSFANPPKPSRTNQQVVDNITDPYSKSWPPHFSFMVGDYVDFRDKLSNLYKISPGKFQNVTQETYCGKALKMLMMISSAPTHFENRKVIRETFGSAQNLREKRVRIVFLFGIVGNRTLQSELETEARQHDDMIQGNFADSYHNLSLSHLLMYNWIQRICEEDGLPKYVLKADDDYFFNLDLALRVAYENPQYQLIGDQYCFTRPIREFNDSSGWEKYYTPRYMYAPEYYVGYLSGVGYLLRTDIIPAMLKISLTTPMIHMDDAYMTGMLARQLNIEPMHSKLFMFRDFEPLPDTCTLKKIVDSPAWPVENIREQWNEWLKPTPPNCSLAELDELVAVSPIPQEFRVQCLLG